MAHRTRSGYSTVDGRFQRTDRYMSPVSKGGARRGDVPVETKRPDLSPFHAEFADFHEGYVRHYINLADTKAAWTFTIASGLLAYLFSRDSVQLALLDPKLSLSNALLLLSTLLLVLSAFYSFRVVAPRLISQSGEGLIFFGSVARKRDADAYVTAVAAANKCVLTEARLKHCYDVSRVCADKYASLKKAIWLGLPGLAAAMVSLLVM